MGIVALFSGCIVYSFIPPNNVYVFFLNIVLMASRIIILRNNLSQSTDYCVASLHVASRRFASRRFASRLHKLLELPRPTNSIRDWLDKTTRHPTPCLSPPIQGASFSTTRRLWCRRHRTPSTPVKTHQMLGVGLSK